MSELDKLYIEALKRELQEKKMSMLGRMSLGISCDSAYARGKEIEAKLDELTNKAWRLTEK